MKTFTYERATSPADALAKAARSPETRFIAGGTNLLDLMKLEIETPAHLVDLNRLNLKAIEPTAEGGLRIGGTTGVHGDGEPLVLHPNALRRTAALQDSGQLGADRFHSGMRVGGGAEGVLRSRPRGRCRGAR